MSNLSKCLCVREFVQSFVCMFVCLFVSSSVRVLFCWFVCSFDVRRSTFDVGVVGVVGVVVRFLRSFVCSFVCPFARCCSQADNAWFVQYQKPGSHVTFVVVGVVAVTFVVDCRC